MSSFPADTLKKTSQLVLQGLKLCIEKPSPLRNEIMTSPDFWVILQTLATNPESAATVFEILESGVSGSPPAIMADNYEATVALLNGFASAASPGPEHKVDRKQQHRKPRPVHQEKSRYVSERTGCKRQTKLTVISDNPAVARGAKAVNIIYDMTSRIPHLMKQSHLENSEGKQKPNLLYRTKDLHQGQPGPPTGCQSSKHLRHNAPTPAVKCDNWPSRPSSGHCYPPS